jgi:RNA polymerase sigma factor (sigma-70 family)
VDESDAEIVGRSTNGDARVFGELFWRHNGAVHGYLARRAGRDTADDLVAEVWLRAFRGRANFDPHYEDARPWLYGIARNVLNAHWRQMSKAPPLLPVAVSDPWPEFEEHIDVNERRADLMDALEALTDDEREALLLVAWEQLTPAEAAAVLGVPPGTVRSRLHRARSALRPVLAGGPESTESTEGTR